MSGNKKGDEARDHLADALDRSDRELKLLANFYHQHGYLESAQDIYRTMLKIQRQREDTHETGETNHSRASDRNQKRNDERSA
ncbi:MAG: hypothetical protein JSS86_13355 [Cyanobacteria bacterium SZAS LIN-2]|nr:hypothetical protein [Cyanobacteria bacterium SZAS LIN-2]